MKKSIFFILFSLVLFGFAPDDIATYKCMIQMKNYDGEGAYIVVSLLDQQGNYVQTLHVNGDDDEWYHEMDEWFGFYGKKRPSLDAITGATVSGGERTVFQVQIPQEKIDSGEYQIRIESAVEDEDYHIKDVQFPLTSKSLSKTHKGKGFIKFVKWIKA